MNLKISKNENKIVKGGNKMAERKKGSGNNMAGKYGQKISQAVSFPGGIFLGGEVEHTLLKVTFKVHGWEGEESWEKCIPW